MLAIFTSIVNQAFPSATTDDVIKATNNALKKLSNDVNKQFDNMKAYIDGGFVTQKKEHLTGIEHT